MFASVIAELEHRLAASPEGLTLDALAGVLADLDRIDALVGEALRRIDAAQGFLADGALTTAAWLRHRCRVPEGRARSMVRTARLVGHLPVTAAAWREGELASAQVELIGRVIGADEARRALFAEHEADLLATLAPLGLRETQLALSAWREHADAVVPPPFPDASRPVEHLYLSPVGDAWAVNGALSADLGDLFECALRRATPAPDPADDVTRSLSERQAIGLRVIVEHYLRTGEQPWPVERAPGERRPKRRRPHVAVRVDWAWLTGRGAGRHESFGGVPYSREAFERLACECELHRFVVDGRGQIVDKGRAVRTCTAAQWDALMARDGPHCRWPAGCDRVAVAAHHEPGWEQGGRTDLATMVGLCDGHHWLRHQPGWTATLTGGQFSVTNPSGRSFSRRGADPPGGAAPAEPGTG